MAQFDPFRVLGIAALKVPANTAKPMPLVWSLLAICCGVEALFQMQGLFDPKDGVAWFTSRSLAVQYGGFWPGLLGNWQPNYPGQPILMFLSYGLLHADLWHLLGNAILLLVLGRRTVSAVGQGGLLLLLVASVVAGGLGYGLMATSTQPMVGLSGGLFGLIAACQIWKARRLRHEGRPRRRVFMFTIWLIVLHFVVFALQDGGLAWQAHLGGYIGGGLVVFLLPTHATAPRSSHHS